MWYANIRNGGCYYNVVTEIEVPPTLSAKLDEIDLDSVCVTYHQFEYSHGYCSSCTLIRDTDLKEKYVHLNVYSNYGANYWTIERYNTETGRIERIFDSRN